MTIEITRPEVEALINERLSSGVFKDAQDVILHALRSSPACMDLFAPLRGRFADGELDFSRNSSTGRPHV
jgi:hypothetical protein